MAKNIYGIDLGSYEIKVYDKNEDTFWKEKDAIAIKNQTDILAVGDEAYGMYERTPSKIDVVFPMEEGVISRFNDMQYLLQSLLKKGRRYSRGAEYVIAVPTDITEVQKKAFFDLVVHSNAKAREINIVERSIADAIGLNLDVQNTKGVIIVNFGGETIEQSVVAEGGLVYNKLLKFGGVSFDRAIVNLVRNTHDFLIGMHTAEKLRKDFGVLTSESDEVQTVSGRDLITGVPMQKTVSINLVRTAMREPLLECVAGIQSLLGRIPPEVRRAIHENGIFLTGGVAHTAGLETYIEESTGIKTRTSVEPDICSVMGLKKIMESKELKKLAYSMVEENYRWMR